MNTAALPGAAGRDARATLYGRWPRALLALACGAAGVALALHYPLLPWAALAGFVAASGVAFVWPSAWVVALPALLPLAGLAPWTGWLSFEEFDLLVLAAAAGGYARQALAPARRRGADGAPMRQATAAVSPLLWALLALFVVSTLVALERGIADAGGFVFGWYQGLREPMNSVRLAKGLFGALLLLPLWLSACRSASEAAPARLRMGLALGLVVASLAAVWERLAFAGLLDFSSDYRTSALFWEMQVGGAAFDGFLALTMPFAVQELMAAGSRRRWLAAAAVVTLGAYVCLTTFSRGVYLAVPVGVAVMSWLHGAQAARRRRAGPAVNGAGEPHASGGNALAAVLLVAGFAAGAVSIFPSSGYRGLLALLGAFAVLMVLAGGLLRTSLLDWVLGLGGGALLAALAAWVAIAWPKGAYIAYALAVAFALPLAHAAARARGGSHAGALALSGFVAVLAGIGLVAWHWGGSAAWRPALLVAGCLIAIAAAVSGVRRSWPLSLRWQAGALGIMALTGCVVGIFLGGAYMGERFANGNADLERRFAHWRHTLALLDAPADLLLGRGLGRFPAQFALTASADERPGDYRWQAEGENGYLALSAGSHVLGWGELLRVSQRVAVPAGSTQVQLDVRAALPVELQLEVCEKHLLYNANCHSGGVQFPQPGSAASDSSRWTTLRVALAGTPLWGGRWYAPRLIAFSVAVANPGRRVDIDNLALIDASGRNLLENGDFSDGMARWFFTSDRNHMPWHTKSLGLHLLFEQGLLGAALWSALVLGALWRTVMGTAREHSLAPPLAGALIGFLVVGLFDSLLNVPRLGWLFDFLLLLALTLRKAPRTGP